MYKKGNMENIKRDLKQNFEHFEGRSVGETIEETWKKFKSILMSTVDKCIPQKLTTLRWNVP